MEFARKFAYGKKMTQTKNGYYEYACPLCSEFVAKRRKTYWSHLREVHREQSIDCKMFKCHYTCVGQQLMEVHRLDKHVDQYDSSNHNYEEKSQCSICYQELTTTQLLQHYRDNHDEVMDVRLYQCRACKIDFPSDALKQKHVRLAHVKKHNNDKESRNKKQCHFCSSWFKGAESLGNHVRRVHTGERPFKCSYCEDSFFSSQELYAHNRTLHALFWEVDKRRKDWQKENPDKDPSEFKMDCSLCGKVCMTIDELSQHWKEAHPDVVNQANVQWKKSAAEAKPTICEKCGKTWKGNQSTHLKIHTFDQHDLEATRCPVCLEEFSDREGAISHIDEKHRHSSSKYV